MAIKHTIKNQNTVSDTVLEWELDNSDGDLNLLCNGVRVLWINGDDGTLQRSYIHDNEIPKIKGLTLGENDQIVDEG